MTRAQQIGVVLGLAIVTALTILRASDPGIFKLIRGVTFDEYQRLVPRTFEPMPVRVIDIDETSLHEFGQWPWPRDRMALLVDRLSEMGASAIAFDILFAEPDRLSPRNVVREVAGVDPSLAEKLPDNDEIFARAIAEKPVVLGFGLSNEGNYRPPVKAGFAFTGESPVSAPPISVLRRRCGRSWKPMRRGLGHISLNPGNPSPVVRAVPLFLTDGEQLYPNLAIEALRVAQGASTYVLSGAPDRAGIMTSVKIGDFVVPLTAAGELWLYVTPDRAERYISARQVLAAEGASPDVAAAVAGSIVFVGTSATGLQDIRVTALGENVPGVSLHAQAVEQILSGRFLSRPDWADGLEILMIAVLGCLLVGVTTFVSPGRRAGLRPADHSHGAGGVLALVSLCGASPRSPGSDHQRIDHPFRLDLVPDPGDRPRAARGAARLRALSFPVAAPSHRAFPRRVAPRRRRSRADGHVRRCQKLYRDQRAAGADCRGRVPEYLARCAEPPCGGQ
ncbi:CHASE2 domain-containing protein [Rhizobium leguminosarum]|nr:CHASE2 domain-containing protein [Rhizobium leguminosarum]